MSCVEPALRRPPLVFVTAARAFVENCWLMQGAWAPPVDARVARRWQVGKGRHIDCLF